MSLLEGLCLFLMLTSSSILVLAYIYLTSIKTYKRMLYKERRRMAKRLERVRKLKQQDNLDMEV